MAKAKAKVEAAGGGALVQLKDTSGSFVDPATGWSLTRDEVAEYPANPGALTAQFRQLGHIVDFEGEAPVAPTE